MITYPPELLPSPQEDQEVEIIVERSLDGWTGLPIADESGLSLAEFLTPALKASGLVLKLRLS
jgi:hypothetical protein